MSRAFSTVTVSGKDAEPFPTTVYVKSECRESAYQQLLGHAILETAGIPVTKIYVATAELLPGDGLFKKDGTVRPLESGLKLYSVKPSRELKEFGDFELLKFVDFVSEYPAVAADMLCSIIMTDNGDWHHQQFVYDELNPGLFKLFDVEAGDAFDQNLKYNLGPYGLLHNKFYEIGQACSPDGSPLNLFSLMAKAAVKSAHLVLAHMQLFEQMLTDKKLEEIIGRFNMPEQDLISLRLIARKISRNRDNWRAILQINAPDLYKAVTALEAQPVLHTQSDTPAAQLLTNTPG